MKVPFDKQHAIGVSVSALIVLVGACLPWGSVDFSKVKLPFDEAGQFGDQMNSLVASMGEIPVTVVNGHASLGVIKLPNMLVLIAALAALPLSWVRIAKPGKPTLFYMLLGMAAYGLGHSLYVLANLFMAVEGSVKSGLLLTTLAFAWMLYLVMRPSKRPSSSPPPQLL